MTRPLGRLFTQITMMWTMNRMSTNPAKANTIHDASPSGGLNKDMNFEGKAFRMSMLWKGTSTPDSAISLGVKPNITTPTSISTMAAIVSPRTVFFIIFSFSLDI